MPGVVKRPDLGAGLHRHLLVQDLEEGVVVFGGGGRGKEKSESAEKNTNTQKKLQKSGCGVPVRKKALSFSLLTAY